MGWVECWSKVGEKLKGRGGEPGHRHGGSKVGLSPGWPFISSNKKGVQRTSVPMALWLQHLGAIHAFNDVGSRLHLFVGLCAGRGHFA